MSGTGEGLAIELPSHKRKILLGRDESIDISLFDESVNSIHAVFEQTPKGALKIFDLNSSKGTFVNGEKVIVADIKPGDVIKLGSVELMLKELKVSELVAVPVNEFKSIPSTKELPDAPRLSLGHYPLDQDSSAEFSEYIFEDSQEVYPIFKYDIEKTALEVIVVYKDIKEKS